MEHGIWTREFLISPELCGMDGRLGVLGGLTLFQALAAEHAEQIGVGFAAMARRREFWLTVHCRIELRKPLALMDSVTGETWRRRAARRASAASEATVSGAAMRSSPSGEPSGPSSAARARSSRSGSPASRRTSPSLPWPPSSRSRAALSTISQSRAKPIPCARRTSTSAACQQPRLRPRDARLLHRRGADACADV